jgi:hypothetical protein
MVPHMQAKHLDVANERHFASRKTFDPKRDEKSAGQQHGLSHLAERYTITLESKDLQLKNL